MKCPSCGDEIRNGRCVFCGYRPTEEDRQAALRYEAQKAAFAGGWPERASPERQEKAKAARPKQAAPRKDAPKPKREPASGTRERRPPKAAEKKPTAGRPGGSRHGFLARLFFRLLIVLWVLAWALAIWGKLSRDLEGPEPVDYPPDGWDQRYMEEHDNAGGWAAREGGSHDA